MESHSEVLADLAELRSQLRARGSPHCALLRLNPIRPLLDIAIDGFIVLCAVSAVVWVNLWMAPLAVCVIANRLRALGNILHDAGHRNLWRDRLRNDLTARALVAHTDMPPRAVVTEALTIAANICIYINDEITVEEL